MTVSGVSSSGQGLLRAGLWTLCGALFFSLMNATAKYLSLLDHQTALATGSTVQIIPVLEVTFARYAVAGLLMLPFVIANPSRLQVSSPTRYLARTVAGLSGIALMFTAVQTIPLASATAIGFTSPIFAMMFAALLLGERIFKVRWIAAVIGLSGALIIASPGPTVLASGALIALAAAAFMGAEIVGVKWLAQTADGAITILFYSNVAGLILSGVAMLTDFVWPTFEQSLLLTLIGTLAIAGQTCIIRAARLSEASFLAPFFYISLLYAAVIGYVVFDEVITIPVAIGCFAILTSAVLMMNDRRPDCSRRRKNI